MQDLSNLFQHLIARHVTMVVVDCLEVVHVGHDGRQLDDLVAILEDTLSLDETLHIEGA